MRNIARNAQDKQQIEQIAQVELSYKVIEQVLKSYNNNAGCNYYDEWAPNTKLLIDAVTKDTASAHKAVSHCEAYEDLTEKLPKVLRALFIADPKLASTKYNSYTLLDRVMISSLSDEIKYQSILEIVSAGATFSATLNRKPARTNFIGILHSVNIKSYYEKVVEITAAIACGKIQNRKSGGAFVKQMKYFRSNYASRIQDSELRSLISNLRDEQKNNILHKIGSYGRLSISQMVEVISMLQNGFGVDINAINDSCATPLINALEIANERSAKAAIAFLKCGADLAIGLSSAGHKPLYLIAQSKNLGLIEFAISQVGEGTFASLNFRALGYDNYEAFMEEVRQSKPYEAETDHCNLAFGVRSANLLDSTASDSSDEEEQQSQSSDSNKSANNTSSTEEIIVISDSDDELSEEMEMEVSSPTPIDPYAPRFDAEVGSDYAPRATETPDYCYASTVRIEREGAYINPIRRSNLTEDGANRYRPYPSSGRVNLRDILNAPAPVNAPVPANRGGNSRRITLADLLNNPANPASADRGVNERRIFNQPTPTDRNANGRMSLHNLLNNDLVTPQLSQAQQNPIPMDINGGVVEEVVLASGIVPTMMRAVEKAQNTSREL